jgi:carbonic anhydrase
VEVVGAGRWRYGCVLSFALIKSLLRSGEAPRLHGWMYSFRTGRIEVLVDGREHP